MNRGKGTKISRLPNLPYRCACHLSLKKSVPRVNMEVKMPRAAVAMTAGGTEHCGSEQLHTNIYTGEMSA